MEYCKEYNDNRIFYRPEKIPNFISEKSQLYYKQYCKVMLMGSGSDEIFCNYMHKPEVWKNEKTWERPVFQAPPNGRHPRMKPHFNFDKFPDDLTEVFPWANFYKGRHQQLITFWENRALSCGLEIRSVYCDKKLVQEWLNLSVHLKNKEHKYFLKEYLRNRNIKLPKSVVGLPAQRYWKRRKENDYQSSI
jgi:asparagine synthetase B (glutamine-hydrolysing)